MAPMGMPTAVVSPMDFSERKFLDSLAHSASPGFEAVLSPDADLLDAGMANELLFGCGVSPPDQLPGFHQTCDAFAASSMLCGGVLPLAPSMGWSSSASCVSAATAAPLLPTAALAPPERLQSLESPRQDLSQQRQASMSPARRTSSPEAELSTAAQRQKIKETNRREKLAAAEARVEELSQQLRQLQMQKDAIAASHDMLERCAAMQRTKGAASVVEGNADAWWIDDKTRVEIQALGDADEMTFTVWPEAPMKITRQQVAELPISEAAALWRAYLAAFTALLSQMNGDPSSPPGQRLARLYYETLQLWGALLSSPDRGATMMRHLLADEGRDSLHAHEHDSEDRRLAAAAAFTDSQRAALCALRQRLLTNLGRLQQQRDDLTAELQAALPRADAVPEMAGGQPTLGQRPAAECRYSRTLALMDRLRDTLRQEHCAYLQANFLFWRKLLTPAQGAQLNVLAYPHDMRVFAVANCIALDLGEPSSAELLAGGASQPSAPLLDLEVALPPELRADSVPPADAGLVAGLPLVRA